MEMKSLSYKNLSNKGLGKVFKSMMLVIMLSVVSLPMWLNNNEPKVTAQYVMF